jgi:hypothetical protein
MMIGVVIGMMTGVVIGVMISFFEQGFGSRGLPCYLHRRDGCRMPASGAAWVMLTKPRDPARIMAIANPDFVVNAF